MKRILAATLVSLCAHSTAFASPLYAGIQVGDDSAGALLGYQINRTYAVEVHYSKTDSSNTQAGVTVDTDTTGTGLVGIAAFPMKLRDVVPYALFAKAGFQHTSSTETYSIPTTATLTLPYNGSIHSKKNQLIIGGGAEYEYSKFLTWRMGLDFIGDDNTFNVGAIFKF